MFVPGELRHGALRPQVPQLHDAIVPSGVQRLALVRPRDGVHALGVRVPREPASDVPAPLAPVHVHQRRAPVAPAGGDRVFARHVAQARHPRLFVNVARAPHLLEAHAHARPLRLLAVRGVHHAQEVHVPGDVADGDVVHIARARGEALPARPTGDAQRRILQGAVGAGFRPGLRVEHAQAPVEARHGESPRDRQLRGVVQKTDAHVHFLAQRRHRRVSRFVDGPRAHGSVARDGGVLVHSWHARYSRHQVVVPGLFVEHLVLALVRRRVAAGRAQRARLVAHLLRRQHDVRRELVPIHGVPRVGVHDREQVAHARVHRRLQRGVHEQRGVVVVVVLVSCAAPRVLTSRVSVRVRAPRVRVRTRLGSRVPQRLARVPKLGVQVPERLHEVVHAELAVAVLVRVVEHPLQRVEGLHLRRRLRVPVGTERGP